MTVSGVTVIRAQGPTVTESAQQTSRPVGVQTSQENAGPRRIRALRVSEAIKVDGRLDEPAWSRAEAATDFRMEEPNEGAPASERTEVRILFDDANLYVGIHAFDSEPARINSRELVRDASFSNDDKVEILLDTYHDRRNAFRFAVNLSRFSVFFLERRDFFFLENAGIFLFGREESNQLCSRQLPLWVR